MQALAAVPVSDPEAAALMEVMADHGREELYTLCDDLPELKAHNLFHARFIKSSNLAYLNGLAMGMVVKEGEKDKVKDLMLTIAQALDASETDAAI